MGGNFDFSKCRFVRAVVEIQQLDHQATNLEVVGSIPAEYLVFLLSFPTFVHFNVFVLYKVPQQM